MLGDKVKPGQMIREEKDNSRSTWHACRPADYTHAPRKLSKCVWKDQSLQIKTSFTNFPCVSFAMVDVTAMWSSYNIGASIKKSGLIYLEIDFCCEIITIK